MKSFQPIDQVFGLARLAWKKTTAFFELSENATTSPVPSGITAWTGTTLFINI
jgi:hypothetical protein